MRRKPKALDEDPTLFAPARGGGGTVLVSTGPSRGRSRPPGPTGGSAPGATEEEGSRIDLADLDDRSTVDRLVHQRAREVAARLAVPRPRSDARTRRGLGELASVAFRGGSSDIDIERTVDLLAADPLPDESDIIVRERVRERRTVILAVDVSGSMKGERVRTAAAAVGALTGELHRDRLGIVAFWSDAAVLLAPGESRSTGDVLDLLLRVPARGLTNVAFALQTARGQLAAKRERDARVVLLSDCVHNAGPDPRPAAAGLPRLDVLLDVTGEHDADLGRDLARAGRGRIIAIRSYRDLAGALSGLFGE